MEWFRMSLGDGEGPPVNWWEKWPEVMKHVFFRRRPAAIKTAHENGRARLIYYLIGGDGRCVAVVDVTGPPQPSTFQSFNWQVPVKVRHKIPGDTSAPRFGDFHPVRVTPGPFASLPADAGQALEQAIIDCERGQPR